MVKVAIVGASLGGLSAANVFHQLGHKVKVFEKFDHAFSDRGGGLGFVDVGLWQTVRGERMMRRGRQATRAQGAFYYGDLWKYLFSGLPTGTIEFDHPVHDLGSDKMRPVIDGEEFDLVCLADGGWSKLRRHVTDTQPEYAGYVCWRGQVDADAFPGGFDEFGVYKRGHFDTIVLPCAKDNGSDMLMGGMFVATPEEEVEAIRPKTGANRHITPALGATTSPVPSWFMSLYREQFGAQAGGALVTLFEHFLDKGELVPHPQFEYAADKVVSGRIVLIGDAAHMASPRTAAGAHTAVLDAIALGEAFQASRAVDDALARYAPGALRRARELYARSREVGRQFMPAGGLSAVQSPSKLVAVF